MIIVSQDKDNIVNFDNIVSIGINDFDIDRETTFQRITAETIGITTVLGDYKTEERAKEVLQEIITRFSFTELEGHPEKLKLIMEMTKLGRYQMPEE